MIHSNSIAGMSLGTVLVLTALSVPAVSHQPPAPRAPVPLATQTRALETLTAVTEAQRTAARSCHADAQQIAAIMTEEPEAPMGTVPVRRTVRLVHRSTSAHVQPQ